MGRMRVGPNEEEHVMQVQATELTDVVFIGRGGNMTLDENDNVVAVTDTESLLEEYYQRCDAAGVPRPTHIEA